MKSQEELRKELEKLRNAEQLAAEKRAALEKELAQLMTPEQSPIQENESDENKDITFSLSPEVLQLVKNKVKQEDMDKVLADYDARPNATPRTKNELVFKSMDDALAFFQEQADKGRSFCAHEVGKDFYIYSDGKGKLFTGTQAQLKEHLEQSPDLTMEETPTPKP